MQHVITTDIALRLSAWQRCSTLKRGQAALIGWKAGFSLGLLQVLAAIDFLTGLASRAKSMRCGVHVILELSCLLKH